MSYQKDREEFVAIVTAEGLPLGVARKLMRYASTKHRLSEALCNGDWPCDNGERKTKLCPLCGGGYAPSSFRKGVCPDCRVEQLAKAAMPDGFGLVIGSDPRGAEFKVVVPSGRTNDWGKEGVCVPRRG